MLSSNGTAAILRAKVDSANTVYTQAQSKFDDVMSELSSGLPGAALRIRQAGNSFNEALRAVNEARITLSNFIAWGYLPDGYAMRTRASRSPGMRL
jgi:hypothetical protein